MSKNISTLDHIKKYIELTQEAKIEKEKGNEENYKALFEKAEDSLRNAKWSDLIKK